MSLSAPYACSTIGFYQLIAQTQAAEGVEAPYYDCFECDKDWSNCTAVGQELPMIPMLPNWYRIDATSQAAYQCPFQGACLGGTNVSAQCAHGHEGMFCSSEYARFEPAAPL